MPKYNPGDQINGGILEPGSYEAVVKRAENKLSKAAKARHETEPNMIEVILTVYGTTEESDVFDYLLFDPKMLHKVRHFCDSAGIDFMNGDLDATQCVGKNVRVRLGVKDDDYGRANVVKDYLMRTSANGAPVTATKLEREPEDADIPF